MDKYCVLMSVYAKDQPSQFREAAFSMLGQSCLPAQFVLVKDGPVPAGIQSVIEEIREQCDKKGILLTIVPLPENKGLGPALTRGLSNCRYPLVARMDADDVSLPDRCEKQLAFMESHPEISVLSGPVLEFDGAIPAAAMYPLLVRKTVPLTHEEILASAPIRNPVNHPTVMFRLADVLSAGGYHSVPCFEDYDLWLRMLFDQTGAFRFAALPEPLLLMRTGGMYRRRGGPAYAKKLLRFRHAMYKNGYISLPKHLYTTGARLIVSLIPPEVRERVYRNFLRSR